MTLIEIVVLLIIVVFIIANFFRYSTLLDMKCIQEKRPYRGIFIEGLAWSNQGTVLKNFIPFPKKGNSELVSEYNIAVYVMYASLILIALLEYLWQPFKVLN